MDALIEFVDSKLVAPCNPLLDANICSERAKKYSNKWLARDETKIIGEIDRLGKIMDTSESTAELRKWMRERRDILRLIHKDKMAKGGSERYVKSDEL